MKIKPLGDRVLVSPVDVSCVVSVSSFFKKVVATTGIEPVTFRLSVERSTI